MWENWLGTDEELEDPNYREGLVIWVYLLLSIAIVVSFIAIVVSFIVGGCPSG